MAFTEDLSVFFNVDDFNEVAIINGKGVPGLFSYGTVVVNEVETRKPLFTCAAACVKAITQGSLVQLQHQTYQVANLKPDGTGLVVLILEK